MQVVEAVGLDHAVPAELPDPDEDYAASPNNHSPRAQFSDEVLSDGVLLHAELAVRALERDAAA